jgi:hypothetical protein
MSSISSHGVSKTRLSPPSAWELTPPKKPGVFWHSPDGKRYRLVVVGHPVSRYGVVFEDSLVEIMKGVSIGWAPLPEGGLWHKCQPPPLPNLESQA